MSQADEFLKVAMLAAQEIAQDKRFIKALQSFYADMKLCGNDDERLLAAKLLVKTMDRVKDEYINVFSAEEKRAAARDSNICYLRNRRPDGVQRPDGDLPPAA